ncbi:DEAD/DEAH box helicase [Acetobacteraceae bacterium H6797]|nr:DEAD/DEAH box helicase [Acetobacteraceae bacterium H6797]
MPPQDSLAFSDPSLLADPALFRNFPDSSLKAGKEQWEQGRVRRAKLSDDGKTIEGVVQGEDGRPYRQRISLLPGRNNQPRLSGRCGCVNGLDCKHVVAAFLEYRAEVVPDAAAPQTTEEVVTAEAQAEQEVEDEKPAFLVPDESEAKGPIIELGPAMVPGLRLIRGNLSFDPKRRRGAPPRVGGPTSYEAPLARLAFHYGPLALPLDGPQLPPVITLDGQRYKVRRDIQAEQAALRRMGGVGFMQVKEMAPTFSTFRNGDEFLLDEEDGVDWVSVMIEEIPALKAAGWRVEVDRDFPVRIVLPDDEVEARFVEGSGIDWLELHLGTTIDGERVDLVPVLLRLIESGGAQAVIDGETDRSPLLLPLPDGRLLTLTRSRIRPTLAALMELFEGGMVKPEEGPQGVKKVRFSRHHAAEIARFEEETGLEWKGGESLRALGRQLRSQGGAIPPATPPEQFKGSLRPYQAQGVGWLQFLRAAGLGGVLADDMGLGKTVQTLAHLSIEQAEGRLDRPALIVCPTSLIPNWTLEAEKFAPTLKVLPLHGASRKSRFKDIPKHDLVLTTYPLLTRDHEVLTEQEWHAVILDEAQTIKNPNAETTRQALRLKSRQRVCLSGTPLQNHLGELWSLFDFLSPGFLGDAKSFRTDYRTPIEKHGDTDRQQLLSQRVRPFLLRRTKDEVVKDLPPKIEINEAIEMGAQQRAVYDAIRLAMNDRVQAAIQEKGISRSGIIILDALLKMRQACCDPRLLKLPSAQKAGSAKLDRLMELLTVLMGEDRRVLIFSQFTGMLSLIEDRLKEDGVDFVTLTGETSDRLTPVRRFQEGEVPVFLISLKAGGVGLNLTRADTVIHFDPWWNPAAEDQATDRAYRIGQKNKVFVHRMITLGTIEEKMEQLKRKKRALLNSVMKAEQGGALTLAEEDIEALFAEA